MEALEQLQRECIEQLRAIFSNHNIIYKDIVTFEYTPSIFITVPYKAKNEIIDILIKNNIGVIHNTDENLILVNPLEKQVNGIELEYKPKEKKESKKYKKVKQTGQLKLF